MTPDVDSRIRLRAMEYLREQQRLHGEVLSWSVLRSGFEFEGQLVKLMGPQGIFKPASMSGGIPLSITTAPNGPYNDGLDEEGVLFYRYRGTDPNHHENVGLRRAISERTPLIYFRGLVEGR